MAGRWRITMGVATLSAALTAPTLAHAHVWITSHTPRYPMDEIKQGPCGRAGGGPGASRYSYGAGATVELTFDEFVDHPGYFRVSFDDDGDDDFVDPPTIGDPYTNHTVLLDNIPDKEGGAYTVQVILPDIECSNCTLQLAQIMTDKPPFGSGNDLYYNCVDIELVADGDPSSTSTGDASSGSTGDTTESSTASGGADESESGGPVGSGEPTGCRFEQGPSGVPAALWLLPGLVALRRRR